MQNGYPLVQRQFLLNDNASLVYLSFVLAHALTKLVNLKQTEQEQHAGYDSNKALERVQQSVVKLLLTIYPSHECGPVLEKVVAKCNEQNQCACEDCDPYYRYNNRFPFFLCYHLSRHEVLKTEQKDAQRLQMDDLDQTSVAYD